LEEINSKYKSIEVKLGRDLQVAESNIIKELEAKFSKDNFFFMTERDKLIFKLKAIDLIKFRTFLTLLMAKYNYFPQEKNIFLDILTQIESIKSYGIRAGKRVYVDYNIERKVQNRQHKILKRRAHFYAAGNQFTKEENRIPTEFVNRIICGDSEEVLKKLPSNSVDLIFTSPPYNFGLSYEATEDSVSWERYFEKLFAIFKECIRVLKYGGRIIVDVQPLFSDYIPIHHIISDFFMKNKLIWKGEILWEKHHYSCKYTAWGSWKRPSSPYLKYTWEFLEVFCKGSLTHKGDKKNADITEDEFKKWVYAKWDIAPERRMKEYGHPAMFPEALVRRVLKLFSFKGDFVLDPFNGVGSTTAIAKEMERQFLGIDISKKYCEIAENRLKKLCHSV